LQTQSTEAHAVPAPAPPSVITPASVTLLVLIAATLSLVEARYWKHFAMLWLSVAGALTMLLGFFAIPSDELPVWTAVCMIVAFWFAFAGSRGGASDHAEGYRADGDKDGRNGGAVMQARRYSRLPFSLWIALLLILCNVWLHYLRPAQWPQWFQRFTEHRHQ
jgi:hypothetical protein